MVYITCTMSKLSSFLDYYLSLYGPCRDKTCLQGFRPSEIQTSLDIIFFKKRIIKALIRLRGCPGWSAPLLFANPRRQVFSRRGPYYLMRLLLHENLVLYSFPGSHNFCCLLSLLHMIKIAYIANIMDPNQAAPSLIRVNP